MLDQTSKLDLTSIRAFKFKLYLVDSRPFLFERTVRAAGTRISEKRSIQTFEFHQMYIITFKI